jgi:hypothetical protein
VDPADRLIKLAECLTGRDSPVSELANAVIALRCLDRAGNASRDIRVQANTKAVAGFIYERYICDAAAAIACYRAALDMVPGDPTLIEAVERLEKERATPAGRGRRTRSAWVGE